MSETMNRSSWCWLLALVLLVAPALPAHGQTTQAAPDAEATRAIGVLRTELVDAFNKGDLDRLLSHLDPDCVVTWQNAEVCRGPEAVRAYYNKMMTGPQRRVEKVSADPVVDDRHIYGDWAVSWGHMRDHFVLTDGSELPFDSRFTATLVRRGEEWKVASFHLSVNAFDNPILRTVAHKMATWAGVIAGVIGLIVGLLCGWILSRGRRRSAAVPPPATAA